ncbi:hypothetical protein H312_01761 [Anncaliia algerae PRA339]|uniref:Major facilitator superfamily (MFS) profile domain-containing protein n=1 Tax=Anncaliia algerae PRA339 TaxID=1288291 RepID=A0A059F1D0_9MICR|nr:hypothetical protein H312_01761 [Anncaliia algerae PRA339]
MEEDKSPNEMSILDPGDERKVPNNINPIKRFFDSFIVSLIGLGFGLAVTSSILVEQWMCKESQPTVLSTNGTTIASETSQFNDSYLINDTTCVGKWSYSFYITCIFLAAMIATIGINCITMARKNVLFISALLFSAGFFINTNAMDFVQKAIVSRFFIGFGIGLSLTAMVPYIRDNASKGTKNILSIIGPANIPLGCLINTLIGLIGFTSVKSYSWVFFGYGLFFLLMAVYILTLKDNEILNDNQIHLPVSKQKKSLYQYFKENKKALIANILLHICQQWSFINGVIMFSNTVFRDSKTSGEWLALDPVVGSVILTTINVIGGYISALWCHFTKDKILIYCFSHCLVLICLFFLGAQFQSSLFSFIYIFGFAIGLGPMVWAIGPELFKEDFRKKGISIGNMVNWISSFIIPYIYGVTDGTPIQKNLFFVGAGLLLLNGVILFYLLDVRKAFKKFNKKDEITL